MSQKTLNLCLERYNFVKFGETTKSSHTVLCTNNAYSVNSNKYRLTPAAIASKHGEGYVFTLNYDFDRPLFTIVQKSYTLDGTSGNIVFEGIDPISKGGSKYLRKVTVSPVKLSDGSYLLEVTNDEYLRIGTTGAALGDEELESLNEKIVTIGGIEKSVETVGGKQVLRLDGSGPSGKEIVYFDIDPSDPPSGIYEDIGTALSSNKLPAIRSDGKLYLYTSTGTDRYDFAGVFSTDNAGYEVFTVWNNDTVNINKLNASLGYSTLPASGTEGTPAWAKVCELDLSELMGNGYSSYGLALLFTSDHVNQTDKPVESGIFVFDLGTNQHSNSNSRNASWVAYTTGAPYQKILGAKVIVKCGIPSNPAYAPYPIYKAEVWVKYYGSSNIIVNALQNACYNYNHGMYQGLYKFPDDHIATPQSTEPSYSDTEEYTYRYHFYPTKAPNSAPDDAFYVNRGGEWVKAYSLQQIAVEGFPVDDPDNYEKIGDFNGNLYPYLKIEATGTVDVGMFNYDTKQYDAEFELSDETHYAQLDAGGNYEIHAKGSGTVSVTVSADSFEGGNENEEA